MTYLLLAHAGGLDEMGIFVIPALVGFGTWMLTRRQPQPDTKPNALPAQVSSSPPSGNGTPLAQPGWKQGSDRFTTWTPPDSS